VTAEAEVDDDLTFVAVADAWFVVDELELLPLPDDEATPPAAVGAGGGDKLAADAADAITSRSGQIVLFKNW